MRGVMWTIKHIMVMTRGLLLLAIALFLPQIYLWHTQQSPQIISSSEISVSTFRLGVENVSDIFINATSKKTPAAIALVTDGTGVDQEGKSTFDVLVGKGLFVKKILVPQATIEKKMHALSSKRVPVISLSSKKGNIVITKDQLSDIDVLMVDMQDSGMHYYGCSSILLSIMKAAAIYKKKCIVLDRPNLLGWCMEGFCPELPLRYGMTVGEIAHYYNKYVLGKPIDLEVVPMANYNRCIEAGSLLTSSLSSEIKNIDSCYGYSFLGLLAQVAPFDTGVGTDKAFQCILLPEKIKFPKTKWQELGSLLRDLGVESKVHRYYNARKKYHCSGLRLHINDINHFSSFKALLAVLNFFTHNGVQLRFSPLFDQAVGSKSLRSLVQGSTKYADLATHVNNDLQLFFNKACSCFLYKPYPKMIHV